LHSACDKRRIRNKSSPRRVTPVKTGAGSGALLVPDFRRDDVWMPAFAGMTSVVG